MVIVLIIWNSIFRKIEEPVFWRQVINAGLGAEFRHQTITGIFPDQFTKTNRFLGSTIGNCIFIFISKVVNSVRASRNAIR